MSEYPVTTLQEYTMIYMAYCNARVSMNGMSIGVNLSPYFTTES